MDLFTQRCKSCGTIHKIRTTCDICAQKRVSLKPILTERMTFNSMALYDNGSRPIETIKRLQYNKVNSEALLPDYVRIHVSGLDISKVRILYDTSVPILELSKENYLFFKADLVRAAHYNKLCQIWCFLNNGEILREFSSRLGCSLMYDTSSCLILAREDTTIMLTYR